MLRAKLLQNGASQAVRLPKECRSAGGELYVKQVGRTVVLLPLDGAWDTLRESLDLFSDDFMAQRAQPEPQALPAFD